MRHAVADRIDRDRSDSTRTLVRQTGHGEAECRLQLWLPVRLDDGGWVAAVHITGLDLPPISAMPGEDALDALIRVLAFAREVVDRAGGGFLCGDRGREAGGLPFALDRGYMPDKLAEIEVRAADFADRDFALPWPDPKPGP